MLVANMHDASPERVPSTSRVENLPKVLKDLLPLIRFPTMTTEDVAMKVASSGHGSPLPSPFPPLAHRFFLRAS